jgi:competence protein ComGC
MRVMVPVLMLLAVPTLLAQEKSVEHGVYTAAQAARGA